MQALYQKHETLLLKTTTDFKRYLFDEISWDSRMIGIIGPRGVGKTTLILQYLKENLTSQKALYASADDLYFSENKLYELADDLHKNGGTHLFIDEIHKYEDWSRELKNIYDSFPSLHIVFTGSSVLDILKGSNDLSRRAIMYQLEGLSFREYLELFHHHKSEVFSLHQIVNHEAKLKKIEHPLPLFRDYLKRGYYAFGLENEFKMRLGQVLIQTLETDIPQYANLSVATVRKLKRLLVIIAESVPFKPNFSKIAEMIGVSRNSLETYFVLLEKAGLVAQLRSETGGIRGLGKVEKVYLANTNIIFNLANEKANLGNLRETFFFNQMRIKNEITSSKKADFIVDNYTFEIGGKNKPQKQLQNTTNSFVVKDDIEYGYRNEVPLWAFGLRY